jgi:hypothetical protein
MSQYLMALTLCTQILSGLFVIKSPAMSGDEPAPKVYLNHFYLTVDSPTYKDILGSDFLKNEFAHFEERTTVVNDNDSYTGAYVYGKNTYFEFFDGAKSEDFMPPGLTSGMAFGVDQKDEITSIHKKLERHKNADFALRTRAYQGVQIPWCFISAPFYGESDPDIMTWVMEYHQDFLKKWHPALPPSNPGIARGDILERYAAKIAAPDQPKDKILIDVIEVNLDLTPRDFDILAGELSVFNYKSHQEGNRRIFTGPDVSFIIDVIAEGTGKITGIRMSCRPSRHKEEASFTFGKKSRLVLHADNTATWIF